MSETGPATARTPQVLSGDRFGASDLPGLLRLASSSDRGFTVQRHGCAPRQLSFGELAGRARAVASGLRERGVGRGDRVCLLSPTSPELVAAMWGVWEAGAVVVVLAPPAGPHRVAESIPEIERRCWQAASRTLVVADELARAVAERIDHVDVVPTGALDGVVGDAGHVSDAGARTEPDDIALLQFTSGTTARSRAVALTHRQLLSNLAAISDALRLGPDDRGLSWLPLYHDMGIVVTMVAVANTADLLLLPTEDFVRRPGSWLDAASAFGATVTVGPSMGYALAAKDLRWRPRSLDLSRLRVLGNGAEPIDPRVFDDFLSQVEPLGVRPEALCPMYGLAEAVLAVTSGVPDTVTPQVWVDRHDLETAQVATPVPEGAPHSRRLMSCGPPVPGTTVEIRDDGGDELPAGRVGEIWVRSPSVMTGYFRDRGASEGVLSDGWLGTGDRGFLHSGELVVCGRTKDMIIVGGRNLYPEDYEQLAGSRDGVRHGNVVAFGLPERERMVVLVESAWATERAQGLVNGLLTALTRELSHAPEEVVAVRPGSLPKTSSGKLQRDRCRQRYEAADFVVVASARRV